MTTRKAIPGYEGFYEVTAEGEVFSLITGRFLKPYPTGAKRNYMALLLCRDGVRAPMYVHTAVLLAFRGSRPEGKECRHLNGDCRDNRLENLEWGTTAEQIADRKRHGTFRTGNRRSQWALPPEDEAYIRTNAMRPKDYAALYGIPVNRVYDIRERKAD